MSTARSMARPRVLRREDAQRHAHQHPQAYGRQCQGEGYRKPRQEGVEHPFSRHQGRAEVAPKQVADIAAVLHDERIIEAHFRADPLDRLRIRVRPRVYPDRDRPEPRARSET